MTFDLASTAFFMAYIGVTTLYGIYMRRVGLMQGINETLITISESKSDILKAAMKELEDKAERHFRGQ